MKYNPIFLRFPHYRVVVEQKNVLKWIIFHYHASPLSVMELGWPDTAEPTNFSPSPFRCTIPLGR